MKDLSIYFTKVNPTFHSKQEESIGNIIRAYNEVNGFPTIDGKGIAIFDVPEYRNSEFKNHKFNLQFRNHFYNLFKGVSWETDLYDLGTIIPGKDISDTIHAVESVCYELIKNDVIPIVIGGTQELTMGVYNAYEKLEQLINLSTIDNKLDIGDIQEDISANGWLNHILLKKPSFLFNYSNIGAQAHYISPQTFNLFEELQFDICRLGTINNDIEEGEPYLRNTDVLSFDLTSIRSSDLQNLFYTSPNGLFANEICRLMRYAGISDKLSSVGIFNYYSDNHEVTDELVAQLIWYFIEGYSHRKGDFPIGAKKEYLKYRVYQDELGEEIVFYKSNKSGRWWIEVPYPSRSNSKLIRHQLVPCSYKTYKKATKGEIPNLWWRTYQKFV
ncbi:MAG: formimidoylglutamase [Brumimicrobium sp.]